MFSIIRNVFGCVLLLGLILLVLKFSKRHKGLKITASVLIAAIVTATLFFLPFENIFTRFDTAQNAAHYQTAAQEVVTVFGEDSALVVCSTDSNRRMCVIVPQDAKGWKLYPLNAVTKETYVNEDCSVSVYRCSKTKGCYIGVDVFTDTAIHLSDSLGSEFTTSETQNTKSYFTYIPIQEPSTYRILIDDEELSLKDMRKV